MTAVESFCQSARALLSASPVWIMLGLAAGPGAAATTFVPASQDNTLIEDADGALSNGAGDGIWAGRTGQPEGQSIRRAVLAFDLSGALPTSAEITSVTLQLTLVQGNPTTTLAVHRLDQSWGEGASSFPGGQGAASEPGDATWKHTFYDISLWASPGGDFAPTASAAIFSRAENVFTWTSSELLSDVQSWLADPESNHGWIVLGDETVGSTSVRFGSRELDVVADRPMLIVEHLQSVPLLRPGSLLLLVLALSGLGAVCSKPRVADALSAAPERPRTNLA
ncbi:MAG: DNRLRE domain-containing protein [Deltaproteobacteria bacterium]|nr:DNRLRE domain-containing protein [Deltaproteobacteria bacterium]